MAENYDAIETVVYKHYEATEQLREGFHRSSPILRSWQKE
jgi:hypothetical protein